MKLLLALPFCYFAKTRLTQVSFHAMYEWLSAALVVLLFGAQDPAGNLATAFLCYLAFIALYELGYLANDYYAVRKEASPRLRGPQATPGLLALWVLVRLAVFAAVTVATGHGHDLEWYGFFAAIMAVFAAHNLLTRRELKALSFSWLAVFRFVAPMLFVVRPVYLPMLWLSAVVYYANFRLYGYLDSKDLLDMPGRKSESFRVLFFVFSLPLALLLSRQPGGELLLFLSLYFACCAGAGVLYLRFRLRSAGPQPR